MLTGTALLHLTHFLNICPAHPQWLSLRLQLAVLPRFGNFPGHQPPLEGGVLVYDATKQALHWLSACYRGQHDLALGRPLPAILGQRPQQQEHHVIIGPLPRTTTGSIGSDPARDPAFLSHADRPSDDAILQHVLSKFFARGAHRPSLVTEHPQQQMPASAIGSQMMRNTPRPNSFGTQVSSSSHPASVASRSLISLSSSAPPKGLQIVRYGQLDPSKPVKRKDDGQDKTRKCCISKLHGACFECKKSRKRCGGDIQCNRCRKSGLECIRKCVSCWQKKAACDTKPCCAICTQSGRKCARPAGSPVNSKSVRQAIPSILPPNTVGGSDNSARVSLPNGIVIKGRSDAPMSWKASFDVNRKSVLPESGAPVNSPLGGPLHDQILENLALFQPLENNLTRQMSMLDHRDQVFLPRRSYESTNNVAYDRTPAEGSTFTSSSSGFVHGDDDSQPQGDDISDTTMEGSHFDAAFFDMDYGFMAITERAIVPPGFTQEEDLTGVPQNLP